MIKKSNPMHWDALPDVLTIKQASIILQVTGEYVRKNCADGTIPATKIGKSWRISKHRLMALMGEEATTRKNYI